MALRLAGGLVPDRTRCASSSCAHHLKPADKLVSVLANLPSDLFDR